MVYGRYLLGNIAYVYNDIGSDTIQQYLPYYIGIVDSIQDGTFSFWDASFGLGSSRFLSQAWLFDPFNLITIPVALLFGQSTIPTMLVAVQIIRIFLSAFLFRWYISLFCKVPFVRVLGSVLFAFNGFMILWGEHYWFGNASIDLMLILISVELLMRERSALRFALLAVMIALISITSVYLACMTFIFGAIYAVLRCMYSSNSVHAFFRLLLPIVASVLIGLLLSCFVLVPSANLLLLDSIRIAGSHDDSAFVRILSSALHFMPLDQSVLSLSRIFSSNSFVTGLENAPFLNYYEIVQVGASVGAIILAIQFLGYTLTNRSESWKNKLILLIVAIAVLSYFFSSFFPTLFNLGASLSYRSSYCIAMVLIATICLCMERVIIPRNASIPILTIATLLSLAILLYSYINATGRARLVCIVLFTAIILFSTMIILYQRNDAQALLMLAAGVLIVTSCFDAYVTTNMRTPIVSSEAPTSSSQKTDTDTTAALTYLVEADHSLYRIEKSYPDWTFWNDALVQNYDGVAVYNTAMAGKLIDFYSTLWPMAQCNTVYYESPRNDLNQPELFSILGVKYILSQDELTYPWCSENARFGNVIVYENTGFNGFGRLFNKAITQSEYEENHAEGKEDILDSTIILPDNLFDNSSSTRKLNKESSEDLDNIGAISLEKQDDGHYVGTVQAATNAIAMIPILRDNGWTVWLDNIEIETFDSDYAFIGFTVDEGGHTIELKYSPYGFELGLTLSISGVALLLISCFIIFRTTKKSHQRQTQPLDLNQ